MAACSRRPNQLPVVAPQQPAGNVAATDAETGSPSGALTPLPQAGETTPLGDAALIEMGQAIYAGNCAPYHQSNGEGTLSIFPALNRNAFVMVSDPTGLIETVLHGRQLMPAFEATLSAQEVAAVLSYVRNGWNNQAAVVTEAQVREVQARNTAQAASIR
jgi:mono/diheme cytochrome c family protein